MTARLWLLAITVADNCNTVRDLIVMGITLSRADGRRSRWPQHLHVPTGRAHRDRRSSSTRRRRATRRALRPRPEGRRPGTSSLPRLGGAFADGRSWGLPGMSGRLDKEAPGTKAIGSRSQLEPSSAPMSRPPTTAAARAQNGVFVLLHEQNGRNRATSANARGLDDPN